MGLEPLVIEEDLRLRRATLEEWIDLPDDERAEWVDGWLVEEEMPSYLHDLVASWFVVMLGSWIFPRGGSVTALETKFVVAPSRGRKPDASVFFPSKLPSRNAQAIERPADIMLEVLSPRPRDRRRDRVEKLAEYARFGVAWYWIVDPLARTLEVFQLDTDGRYVLAVAASSGTVEPPGCSELQIDLDALWKHVDAHPDDQQGTGHRRT